MSVVSVLKGEPLECECPSLPEINKIKPIKCKASYAERENELRQALTYMPPISLVSVANKLKLHSRSLTSRFPELSAEIVTRFEKHRRESINTRRQHELLVAKNMINKLREDGISCTQRNFSKLTDQILLPGTSLWVAIKMLLAEESSNAESNIA